MVIDLDNQNSQYGIPFAPELLDMKVCQTWEGFPFAVCDGFPFCCLTNECDGCGIIIDWQEMERGNTSYLRNPCDACRAEEEYRDGDHDAYDRRGDR